jgi:hypothetical protein
MMTENSEGAWKQANISGVQILTSTTALHVFFLRRTNASIARSSQLSLTLHMHKIYFSVCVE